jgi:hypothetical protein
MHEIINHLIISNRIHYLFIILFSRKHFVISILIQLQINYLFSFYVHYHNLNNLQFHLHSN